MVARQNLPADASLVLDGKSYIIDRGSDEPAHVKRTVRTQPGDPGSEFEKRIENAALGWGMTKDVGPGGYDYGAPAVLNKRLSWLPGAAITDRLGALTAPDGPCAFGEYWDGTDANRRLIIVSSRRVYEVQSDGTITHTALTALVPVGAKMTRPTRYKAPTAMAAPKVFIPVQNGGATDYFIVRTGANTYVENTGTKRAVALAVVKDSVGEDVMARVTEEGRLNLTTEDTDPNAGASWATSGGTYGIGETSALVNDLFQQNRAILIGRADGAYTFDNLTNAVPVTRGMEQTPDADNFRYFKDFNGITVAPTVQGLVYIDSLEWGVCGPVSSNPDAKNLRGREVAVSGQAGEYLYCAVYFGTTSYIFLGTPRTDEGTGHGLFVWHGPVASVSGRVTDLHVSTVWGKKLWLGFADTFKTLDLNDDFSPKSDATSGYIYLPEGVFDQAGPGVIKDFRKAEFIAPAGVPFGAANKWSLELETTPGSGTYVAIDGGAVSSGVYAERFWTTETSGRRLRGRIAYTDNGGSAELEAVIVRGTQRPESTEEHDFRVTAADGQRTPGGIRMEKTAETVAEELFALRDSGRKTAVSYGLESFTGQVTDVREVIARSGERAAPVRVFSVTVRRIKTA